MEERNFLKRGSDPEDEASEAKSLKIESLSCELDPNVVLLSSPLDADENDTFVKIKMSKAVYSEYGENTANRKTKNLVSAILSDMNNSTNNVKKQEKNRKSCVKDPVNGQVIYPRSSNLERLYCDECNYQCRYVSVLMKHKQTHLKEGMLCKICGFAAKHINTMKIHELTHIDNMPFPCEQCNYKGKTIHDLKKHRSIHPQLNLLFCNYCHYSCVQSVMMEQHKVIHESEIQHGCDHCGVVLKNSDELDEHMTSTHADDPVTEVVE